MTTPNPLAAMFDGAPVLMAREHKAQIEASLVRLAAHERFEEMLSEGAALAVTAAADDGFWPAADDWRAALRPYVVENGTLVIPVKGVLLHNFPWQFGNWATGYDYIWRAFERGLGDGNVQRIALVINSGGGVVAGNQDLVDRMYARRDEKPLRAFAHEAAYSAAYNIASVAPEGIVVSRTGGVGSIGVRATHIDWSKWNEAHGLTYSILFEGEGKTDGDPDQPLSDRARARLQERLGELYDVFVESVARNRGLEEAYIREELKAFTYSASQATSNQLADSIGRLDDAMAEFAADPSHDQGENEMSTPDNSAANQAAIDEAVNATRAEAQQAQQAAVAAAVKAERERVAAITGCDEAKGRESLANHIAMNTEMSLDDAKAMLKAAQPAEATVKQGSGEDTPFNRAAAEGNPNLGNEGGKEKQEVPVSEQILTVMFGPEPAAQQ